MDREKEKDKGGTKTFLRSFKFKGIKTASLLILISTLFDISEGKYLQEYEYNSLATMDQIQRSRFLQVTCPNPNQFVNTTNRCAECAASCATCVSPTGSCERCAFTLPTVTFPMQNQIAQGSGATCAAHGLNCQHRDPFCMDECPSVTNGGKCNQCLKGTMITPIRDPQAAVTATNQNTYSCRACNVPQCTNCLLTTVNGVETTNCIECERNFILSTDSSTGTPVQRCVRSSTFCPNFCICDFGGTMNCTRCNDTNFVVVKEAGLSNFGRCVRQELAPSANLDCGEKCTTCNSLTGTCLECEAGFMPNYDITTFVGTAIRFTCQPTCGPGCLSCNEATRSCMQCDDLKNFTMYTIDDRTQTKRCFDTSNMCDDACINCNTRALLAVPFSTVGVCQQCKIGYFVNNIGRCDPCPDLCQTCATVTGSCFDCTNIKYTLYRNTAQSRSLCTDKLCHQACLSCSIEEGMNAIGRPYCRRCSQGFFLTNDFDCRLCPLNCGSCDDSTGQCNQCKPGFSLNLRNGVPLCISDSTVGVCSVPNCATCDAQRNTTCAICDPGYDLDATTFTCPCKITLTFKSRFYTQDWLNIQITWNGRVQALSQFDPNDPIGFCNILATQTLIDINQGSQLHQCFLKYDIQSKRTIFTIKLNPNWAIPNDNTASRTPTTRISFDITKLETPLCGSPLEAAQFTNIALTGGDSSNPSVIFSRSMTEVPLCTQQLKISSGLSQGLFGRPATYLWSISSMSPLDSSNAAKTVSFRNDLNRVPITNDVTLEANTISLLAGKTVTLQLVITNFLQKTGSGFVDFIFLNQEGLYLEDVMEEYVVNPQKDFVLTPKISLTACNFSSDTINKATRYKVECSIEKRDPITAQWSLVSILDGCMIPSGLMSLGTTYRIQFVGFDPSREFARNATKQSTIRLVKPPIIAKIIGGDQVVDSNKDLTLAVRGENLGKDLSYKWFCKNPTTGLQCVDLYGNFLFLSGTDSVFIKANILAPNFSYQISFAAADQMDVSRVATDFITISTLPVGSRLLYVTIFSDANKFNNQLNVYEKQFFKANVLNENRNPIANLAQFTFTWTVSDSIGRPFQQFQSNMGSMVIQSGYLQQNNIYQICISVQNTTTKQIGAACTKYRSNGDSNIFSFTVNPSIGSAFTTPFDFTASNTQSLKQQYFYEFGYILYTLNAQNQPIDATYMPFEVATPTSVKTFRMQPSQPGQSNVIKVYTKITGENGERFIYFRDLTVNLGIQNATQIGDTIDQFRFDSINSLFTKVSQVALVSANIEPRYKANVIRTLVEGISNITNLALGSFNQAKNSSDSVSDSDATIPQEKISQRLTISRSLSQVTNLIRADPEIVTNKQKDMLKSILNTMIGLDDSDNEFFASTAGERIKADSNMTLKEAFILTSASLLKDRGQREIKTVEKFDPSTATELLKICDDLFTAESLSNQTDPELKRMAVTGIKKVFSGSINEITNTFAFETATIKAQSQLFVAGKDLTGSKTFQLTNPILDTTRTSIALPNQDLCGGNTCQMNLIAMRNSPITNSSAKLVSSTISITFEKRSNLNENQLLMESLDFSTLNAPVKIQMTLDKTKINPFAKQRCVYFDTKTNSISDQGIITSYNPTTNVITCDTYHLTDFSVMEVDPGAQPLTNVMPANLQRVEIFQPLTLASTTPVVIMIILSVVVAFIVPFSMITDRIQENSRKSDYMKEEVQIAVMGAEKAAADNETTLADVMFFNKYEDRTKPQYSVIDPDTKADDITISQMMEEYDDEDDDAYNILKRKLKMEEMLKKKREAEIKNQARGTYSLFFMLCLALRFQHRVIQLFFAYDPSLSRHSRAWILICSQFINLVVTGIYCKPDDQGNSRSTVGVILALVIQKIVITVLNILMVKLPKLKRQKIDDAELGLNRADPNQKNKGSKDPKFKEYISYKLSPCDKMSFAIGFFLIFAIISGAIFFSISISQQINSTQNGAWAGMFSTLIIIDLAVFEFLAIFISTAILKKVGSHPTALGRFRNYIIKYGPRAIRSANVNHGEQQAPATVPKTKAAGSSQVAKKEPVNKKAAGNNAAKKKQIPTPQNGEGDGTQSGAKKNLSPQVLNDPATPINQERQAPPTPMGSVKPTNPSAIPKNKPPSQQIVEELEEY